jgi:hypothetical protein
MRITSNFTAVSAVSVLANCEVNLYRDTGSEVNGRWVPDIVKIDSNIIATALRAKASEIKRFERGGERLEGAVFVFLSSAPSEHPDSVELNGEMLKVYDVDFRPDFLYWELLLARKL